MSVSQRDILARTLQAEAGSEGIQGMLDVGSVVRNRAASGRYGDGISGVIMRPGQFSAWNGVTGYASGEQGQNMNFTPNEQAYQAADAILSGRYEDQTGGATHYYNPDISSPKWGSGSFVRRGAHVFGDADGVGAVQGNTGAVRVADSGQIANDAGPQSSPEDRMRELYLSGNLSPENMARYEERFGVPEQEQQEQPQGVAAPEGVEPDSWQRIMDAYNSGQLNPENAQQLDAYLMSQPGGPLFPGYVGTNEQQAAQTAEQQVTQDANRQTRRSKYGSRAGGGLMAAGLGGLVGGPGVVDLPDNFTIGGVEIPQGPIDNIAEGAINLGAAGLGAIGGALGYGAGLAGDIGEATGLLDSGSADRLSRDLAAMPEAFAGSPNLTQPGQQGARTAARNANRLNRATAQTDDVAAIQGAGIKAMTSDVRPPNTFAARWLQGAGEKAPFTGTGGARTAQQEQRIGAVRDLLREYGADDAARASDNVMADLLKTRGETVSRYTRIKNEAISSVESAGPVPVTKTVDAIDGQIARLQSLRTDELGPVISRLEDWKGAVVGQDIQNIELLRRQMGEAFSNPALTNVKSIAERSTQAIYPALRSDMGDFIRTNGGSANYNRWRVANGRLSDNMGQLKNNLLRTTLNTGESTPENIRNMLFSSKPSDVRRLFRNLSPEGRNNARTAVLHDVIEKSGGVGNINPDRFLTQLNRRSNQIGVMFRDGDKQAVGGLARALELTRRAQSANVSTATGLQNTLPVAAAVLTQMLGSAGGAIAGMGTVGGIARLYESGPVRNALIGLKRAQRGTPGETRALSRLEDVLRAAQQANREGSNDEQ